MKRTILLVTTAFLLLHAEAQKNTTASKVIADHLKAIGGEYIDYQQYMGGDFREEIMSGKGRRPKTVKALQDSATGLSDEGIPGDSITTMLPGTRILNDEEIYAQRKKSVSLVGKLKKIKDTAGTISFDFIGTAFAISGDGICVTNYHVLQDIIWKNDSTADIDSTCFIETVDRKVYFVEKILAYSRNNDLAVFKVDTRGGKLQPLPPGRPAAVGSTVYCISHPLGNFYYFSKGIVARNLTIVNQLMEEGRYEPAGSLPIRMEITADYGAGSSGGPILDKYGNLIGIVCSTREVGKRAMNAEGNDIYFQQMVIKQAIPVSALMWLLPSRQ